MYNIVLSFLIVLKGFFKACSEVIASQTARQDSTVSTKDDDVGNTLDAIEVSRLGQLLGADNDGPGDFEFLDSLAGIVGIVPHSNTQYVEFVAVFAFERLQLRNLGTAGRSPARPEVHEGDFALAYVV